MFQRAGGGAALWSLGKFPRLIQIDARRVRAGGDAMLSTTETLRGMPPMAIAAEDLDRFARAWLAFREGE